MADPADRGTQEALAGLRRGVAELLEEFYEKIGRHHQAVSGHVVEMGQPPAEAGVSDVGFEISIELPGIEKKDLEIDVTGNRLSVKGKKRQAKEEKGRDYHLQERRYGAFERVFTLSPELDADKTQATYENGVLTVTVPRKKGVKRGAKKIAVKSGR